jgi:hypothetical protein
MVALGDSVSFAGAFFGMLKIDAVVMVNPGFKR